MIKILTKRPVFFFQFVSLFGQIGAEKLQNRLPMEIDYFKTFTSFSFYLITHTPR